MDAAATQSVIASRLPQRARWLIGNDTQDFSLHSEPCSLAAEFAKWGVSAADVADIEHRSDLIVFGMWNYNEGGGARPALVVRRSDGKVFGVDVEANDPLFVLNSSLEAFIDTRIISIPIGLKSSLPMRKETKFVAPTIPHNGYPIGVE
jgi:hypothetical protein